MKNIFDAVVESWSRRDSHAWLRIGGSRLAARIWPGMAKGERVRVTIRPEDIVLCTTHPGPTSARNVLPGHVRRTTFVPDGVDVELDVGFRLVALVTRKAARELELRRGSGTYALVKATAVVPWADAPARGIRVSLVGPYGMLDPGKIDLLRSVEREGSLARAVRPLGISYRTAWIWATEMNRAWGRPLLDRTHGGKGGGGTVVTPEGRGVIRTVTEIESGNPRVGGDPPARRLPHPSGSTTSIPWVARKLHNPLF